MKDESYSCVYICTHDPVALGSNPNHTQPGSFGEIYMVENGNILNKSTKSSDNLGKNVQSSKLSFQWP